LIIRYATLDDVSWIVDRVGEDMFSLLGETDMYDKDYLHEFIPQVIEDGIVLVAERAMEPIGCIAGILSPILFNPHKVSLTEIFWWVAKEHRGSSAGAKLLLAFEQDGIALKVDFINMSIMHNTKLSTGALEKRGYLYKESSYVRRV
jgi:hypothetical protein